MSSTVEQVKSKLNIVDVVGSYLKLDKAGSNLKARCPFHNEKTPSFFVSPSRDSFHCFGCNKGGDIFEFVKEVEGIEFVDALKILAEKAGVKLINEDRSQKSEKGRLISVVENAVRFYRGELKKNIAAKEYLTKRGLTDDTIEAFKIGVAPDSWRDIYDYLKKLQFTDSEIERTGLVIRSPKGFYDRFRNRIMFPINNVSGVTVGFSGRILPTSNQMPHEAAKYINSPQTDLYDKSKVLFGFDRGRVLMRSLDTCVLVEGQMDLIMSHQAGHLNTVAVSGTALTDEHLRNIKRLASKLILAFDGDQAGFKASQRGINMALSEGFDVRIAKLPNDVDPADLILGDPHTWSESLKNAKHIIDFCLEVIEARGYDSRKFKMEVQNLVLPYIASLKSNIEQAHFVNVVSRRLGIDEGPIWSELKKLSTENIGATTKTVENSTEKQEVIKTSRAESLLKRIYGIILWQNEIDNVDVKMISEVIDKLKTIVGDGRYMMLDSIWQNSKDGLIFEAEVTNSGSDDIAGTLAALITDLEEETLKESLNNTIIKLKKAEQREDDSEIEKILKECQLIGENLSRIKQIKISNNTYA
ncbi:MAG: DNA primase [Candidatus Vogelbacteria bacterium]|nr:DNA primase [Candidatus Vogelbacteria bacterium]